MARVSFGNKASLVARTPFESKLCFRSKLFFSGLIFYNYLKLSSRQSI